jgi:hypothetical protein
LNALQALKKKTIRAAPKVVPIDIISKLKSCC